MADEPEMCAEELAEQVWEKLKDRSESYRQDFIEQLKTHMCTNCGGDGSYCCYDSGPFDSGLEMGE